MTVFARSPVYVVVRIGCLECEQPTKVLYADGDLVAAETIYAQEVVRAKARGIHDIDVVLFQDGRPLRNWLKWIHHDEEQV